MAAAGPGAQVEVVVTGYGRAATRALADRLAAARRGHPLDPVTVVVPSNPAGLSARRVLGSGLLGGRGLANVAFVTPFRLAELLGAGAVGDRRPLTNPVLAAAARAVLADEPGHFAAVAGHQATSAALVQLYGELSRAEPATLAAIAGRSERGADVVRLVRLVRARLAGHHDEDDLAEAAARRLAADPTVARDFGAVIWHLPDRLSPAMTVLVRDLLVAAPSSVVVGLTGAEDADAATRALCEATGVPLDPGATVVTTHAERIVSASDPDEEVRVVVRELAGLASSGVRLDRTAVLFPTAEPYARTLLEQLDAAGIDHNGPSVARLADSVAGRTLLAALALEERGWGRGDVIALVAGAPVRHEGRPVAPARWDAVSRQAGVVGGRADWSAKLAGHVDRLRAEAAASPGRDDTPARAHHLDAEARTADALATFVTDLAGRLDDLAGRRTWRERAEGARDLLDGLLGPEHQRTGWPEHEVGAAQRVDVALSRLVVLDEVEPTPGPRAFELAVAAELEASGGRTGRFGDGVLVAPLAAAVGLDLDACFVVGMAEGTCPSFRREDGLLPDDDRVLAVAGELTTRQDRLADQHRHLLAALAAAGTGRTLVLPRGDLRDRRTRLPSRWLLTSASHHAGRPLFSGDLDQLDPPRVEVVASFADGIARAGAHATLVERDLAVLLDHVVAGGELAEHPVVQGALGRGLACHRSRQAAAFTEWDGNVTGIAVPSPATGSPVSPSRLETWASCPLRYFFAHVLHLGDRDDPEEIVELGAADRGSLVHEVLERFIGEAITRDGGPPAPTEPWGAEDRARLVAIAEEAFARYEAEGLTGRPLLWRRTRADVVEELLAFLTRDDAHRAADGLRPVSVEMAFGMDGEAPLALRLPDGRKVTFRGRADRVDEAADGRLVVLDYKTGRDAYTKLDDDPVLGGTTLQLGAYAEAARARHGRDEVDARYWMASTRARFAQRGYRWTEPRRARFLDVVGTIVEGIEAGAFPGRPGTYDAFFGRHANCGTCDFDRICPRDRDDHEQAMAGATELSLLRRLDAGPPDDGPDSDGGPA